MRERFASICRQAVAAAEKASALQGALMLREAPRIPADGCETGDWLHVDVYLSKHPGYRAVLLRGSRYDAGVLDWARQRSASIVAVGAPIEGAVQTIRYPGDDDALVRLLAENTEIGRAHV